MAITLYAQFTLRELQCQSVVKQLYVSLIIFQEYFVFISGTMGSLMRLSLMTDYQLKMAPLFMQAIKQKLESSGHHYWKRLMPSESLQIILNYTRNIWYDKYNIHQHTLIVIDTRHENHGFHQLYFPDSMAAMLLSVQGVS